MDNKNWTTRKLENVCHIEYGTRVVKKREKGTKFPVYGGGGATFSIDRSNREDAIIVSRFGMSEECVRFVKGKFFLNDSGLSVRSKNLNELDDQFLYYLMIHLQSTIYRLGRGSAQKNLNVPKFRELKISYPPLAEQKRIVAILDELFEKLEKAEKNSEDNISYSEDLWTSFLDSFLDQSFDTWESMKLKEVFSFQNGRSFKKSEWSDDGLPIIRIQNLNDAAKEFNYFSGEYENRIEINHGDLLFSWSGTVGTSFGPHIWRRTKGVLNQHIWKIEFKKEVDSQFAFYFLKYITTEIEKKVNGASGLVHVTKTKMKEFLFPNISITEQKRIGIFLSKIEDKLNFINSNFRNKHEKIISLRNSILQKAFSGELTEAYS